MKGCPVACSYAWETGSYADCNQAVLFSWRVLEFCSSSFIHLVIKPPPPPREPFGSSSGHLSLSKHVAYSFFFPPRPFFTPSSSFPTITRLASHPLSMRLRAPAHNNLFVRTVVSKLSQSGSSSPRLYERTRWSDLRRPAPIMRSRTLWRTVCNFF